MVVVTFPDGTRVRAASIANRDDADPTRVFGLYMDPRWEPTWPAEVIAWPDFGLPLDPERAASQIEAAYARAKDGDVVEIGCLAGLGRTGTVLACMAILAGVERSEAVAWLGHQYNAGAVETVEQEKWIGWFAEHVRPSAL